MTQRFSFYEDLSIAENLDFVARMYAVKNRREAVRASLERLGLLKRQQQLAGQLSGGWKQRLALAACLIHNRSCLLLDEPTAGVDPKARREFWEQIHQLAGAGLTFLITTHYMDEAERCHRLAYIAYGRLLDARHGRPRSSRRRSSRPGRCAGRTCPNSADELRRHARRAAGGRFRQPLCTSAATTPKPWKPPSRLSAPAPMSGSGSTPGWRTCSST